jgi:hypothetical protein
MIGQVFKTESCGAVVVSDYKNRENVTVVFVDTGYSLTTKKDVLVRRERPRLRDPLARTVFGVGFIGVGPHKAHHKGQDTKPFSIWRAMLRRCYYRGGAHRQASYDGCAVDPVWHNYQTFAAWFVEHYPQDGRRYQLDKDMRVPGNKTYGPQYCQFVTQQENLAARRGRTASRV